MIQKQGEPDDHALAVRTHCERLVGLTEPARQRLAAVLIDPGPVVELPVFFEPDAYDRFGPIPADLPEPVIGWFNAVMQREAGITPNACDAEAVSVQITAEQREDLSTRHQFARFMVHTLIGRCDGWPDTAQGAAIVTWADHAEDIKLRLYNYLLPLLVWTARRYKSRRVEFAERVSVACDGLLRAIEKHDPRLSSLSHYACVWMRGKMKKRATRTTRWHREWINGTQYLEDGTDRTTIEAAPESGRDVEGLADLDRFLAEPGLLDSRERQILTWRFGLCVDHGLGEHLAECITLEEAGQRMGISRERVRQLECAAMEKLRCRFTSQPIPELRRDLTALVNKRKRGELPDVLDVLEGRA